MSNSGSPKGYFLISLDTELAWGYFDQFTPGRFSPDGSVERQSVLRLLEIFKKYEITATWGVVGHLFYEKCEDCAICPVRDWKGRYSSYDEIYQTRKPLWYGLDLINILRSAGAKHEIAFHGYTHRIFNEDVFSVQDAQTEIREWQRVAGRYSIKPTAVFFPRNVVGHLKTFKEEGFVCYRGVEMRHSDYQIPILGKAINYLDWLLQFRIPKVYVPWVDESGLVNLPGSRGFFHPNERLEKLLDALGLPFLRITRMVKGVQKAAREGKVLHIYTHPEEFRTDQDFEKLEYLLSAVAEEIKKGTIESIGVTDLAMKVIGGQWPA